MNARIPLETVEQSLYEVRRKIYPRAVHGWFARWRIAKVVVIVIIIVLIGRAAP